MAPKAARAGVGTVIFALVVAAFLAFFLLYPVAYMLRRAFFVNGAFTSGLFSSLWRNPTILTAIRNSLFIGIVVTGLCAVVAMPLAILTGRYAFAGKKWLTGVILVPMIMPPFVGAIGMRQMLSRNGTVDVLTVKVLSFLHLVPANTMGLVDIMQAGIVGVIILETLHLYPIMYLNVAAALANVDPALEESARNMGASAWRLFRTVTLPLTMPGFFAGAIIVFVWAFTDLGAPLMFNYLDVIPVHIFNDAKAVEQNVAAFAIVVFVIAICALAFVVSKWFSGRRTYYMLSKNTRGKAEIRLGALGTVLAYCAFGSVTLLAILPHISVVLTSVSGKWFMTALPTQYTLSHYRDVFTSNDTLSGIKNSLFYSAGSTGFDIVIGVGLAYILARKRIFGRGALDLVAMMPLALPGFVLAFGYVAVFAGSRSFRFLDPFINPTLLLMVSYSVRRLPFMVRSVYAGFQQVSPSLEEASANLGATPARTLRTVTVPLVLANILAGAILCFSFAMLEVSDSLILATERQYYPVSKLIYSLSLDIQHGPNLAAAMGVLGMVLLVCSLILAGKVLGEKMGELFRA
jgi:iron(III) transport system permease protein